MAAAVEGDTAAAAIRNGDAQTLTVDPYEVNVLKGPRKGVLLHAYIGSLACRFTEVPGSPRKPRSVRGPAATTRRCRQPEGGRPCAATVPAVGAARLKRSSTRRPRRRAYVDPSVARRSRSEVHANSRSTALSLPNFSRPASGTRPLHQESTSAAKRLHAGQL